VVVSEFDLFRLVAEEYERLAQIAEQDSPSQQTAVRRVASVKLFRPSRIYWFSPLLWWERGEMEDRTQR
jgi:hypothetical protein